MKAYYFADGGQQRGPFPAEELARQGVRPESLVWAEGMPSWVPAHTLPDVAAAMNPGAGGAQPSAQQAYAPPPQAGHAQQAGYPQQQGYPPQGYQGGAPYPGPYQGAPQGYGQPDLSAVNGKKIAAGLCALLLGGFGIHKFVLGFTTAGVIYLLVSLVGGIVTCGVSTGVMGIIALIEGIMYLTKSDAEFYQLYMVQKKEWF